MGLIPGSGRSPGGGKAIHFSILAQRIPWTERSLAGYSPLGCKELDMTEVTQKAGMCQVLLFYFKQIMHIHNPHVSQSRHQLDRPAPYQRTDFISSNKQEMEKIITYPSAFTLSFRFLNKSSKKKRGVGSKTRSKELEIILAAFYRSNRALLLWLHRQKQLKISDRKTE